MIDFLRAPIPSLLKYGEQEGLLDNARFRAVVHTRMVMKWSEAAIARSCAMLRGANSNDLMAVIEIEDEAEALQREVNAAFGQGGAQ